MSRLTSKLLRKNLSVARLLGFMLSNFLGLAIIAAGVQAWLDMSPLWHDDGSILKSGMFAVNKKVSASSMWDSGASVLSDAEISDLAAQPWVEETGAFTPSAYKVVASVGTGGNRLSTMLFFESVPDSFAAGQGADWEWQEGDEYVPIVISRDYLALYNFGFAVSAGLPQITETMLSGIPLNLTLTSEEGGKTLGLRGRIVGLSDRFNTILVPESFMKWSNGILGGGAVAGPSRLMVKTNSPGDSRIKGYLDARGLEISGSGRADSASYLFNVCAVAVLAVGIVIALLSLLILMLSISLLMERNREAIGRLLMLGCPEGEIIRPYAAVAAVASLAAWVLAAVAGIGFRSLYQEPLEGIGGGVAPWWAGSAAALLFCLLIAGVNALAVRRKVLAQGEG